MQLKNRFFVFSFALTLSMFVRYDGLNYLFIVGLLIFVMTYWYKELSPFYYISIFSLLGCLSVSLLYNSVSFLDFGVIYTLFSVIAIGLIPSLCRSIAIRDLLKSLLLLYKWSIVLFFLQILMVLFGLKPINAIAYSATEPYKVNGFYTEASVMVRYLGLIIYFFWCVKEVYVQDFSRLSLLLNTTLYFVVTVITGSSTGIIMGGLLLLHILGKRWAIMLFLLPFVLIFEFTSVDRIWALLSSLIKSGGNLEQLLIADNSGAQRLIPYVVGVFLFMNLGSVSLFGNGTDSSSILLEGIPGMPEDVIVGGFVGLLFDYGIIFFLLLILLSVKLTVTFKHKTSILMWFFLIFQNGLNNQLVLFSFLLLGYLKLYSNDVFGRLQR